MQVHYFTFSNRVLGSGLIKSASKQSKYSGVGMDACAGALRFKFSFLE